MSSDRGTGSIVEVPVVEFAVILQLFRNGAHTDRSNGQPRFYVTAPADCLHRDVGNFARIM